MYSSNLSRRPTFIGRFFKWVFHYPNKWLDQLIEFLVPYEVMHEVSKDDVERALALITITVAKLKALSGLDFLQGQMHTKSNLKYKFDGVASGDFFQMVFGVSLQVHIEGISAGKNLQISPFGEATTVAAAGMIANEVDLQLQTITQQVDSKKVSLQKKAQEFAVLLAEFATSISEKQPETALNKLDLLLQSGSKSSISIDPSVMAAAIQELVNNLNSVSFFVHSEDFSAVCQQQVELLEEAAFNLRDWTLKKWNFHWFGIAKDRIIDDGELLSGYNGQISKSEIIQHLIAAKSTTVTLAKKGREKDIIANFLEIGVESKN